MEAFHNLLQLSGYSTASAACCACGALSAAPEPPRRFDGALFNPYERLAACGWAACSRGSSGHPSRHGTDLCSTWGESPAPDASRCLSRCADYPACCGTAAGCACGADPRERELADFAALGPASPLRQLRYFGYSHALLRPSAADDEEDCAPLLPAPPPPPPPPVAAVFGELLGRSASTVPEPDLNDLSRLGRKLGTPGMRSVGGEQLLNATSCAYLRLCSRLLGFGDPPHSAAALGARARTAGGLTVPLSSERSVLYWRKTELTNTREIGEAHAVVVRVGVGRAFEVALGQYDLLQAAAVYMIDEETAAHLDAMPLLREDLGGEDGGGGGATRAKAGEDSSRRRFVFDASAAAAVGGDPLWSAPRLKAVIDAARASEIDDLVKEAPAPPPPRAPSGEVMERLKEALEAKGVDTSALEQQGQQQGQQQ